MLVRQYRLEIFNNECMPGAMSVQCFAHLDQDVGQALPYLNASLGGFEYIRQPPSVTFRAQGKLITVHARKIAVNALKDEDEARKIVEWMMREINAAWGNRDTIEPSYEGTPKPNIVDKAPIPMALSSDISENLDSRENLGRASASVRSANPSLSEVMKAVSILF